MNASPHRPRQLRRAQLLALLLLAVCGALPAVASAAGSDPSTLSVATCAADSSRSGSLYREVMEAPSKPNGLLLTTPHTIDITTQGGIAKHCRMELYNGSESVIDVSIDTTAIGPASNPRSLVDKVEESEFSAVDWITIPNPDLRLRPFERVRFDLLVTPPASAPIGTNLAGLLVSSTAANGKIGTRDDENPIRLEAVVQAYFTVPGPIDHKLTVQSIKLRDRFALSGRRVAVWDITFKNDSTVNEHVTGAVTIRSLFGSSAERYRLKDLIVLRGATRVHRVIWPDVPWVGSFHPEVRVRGDDAKVIEESGPGIYVLPWWILVLIVVSLLVPMVVGWWRRRLAWEDFIDDHEHPEGWVDGETWDDGQEPEGA